MNGDKLKYNLHTFLRHLDSINETLPMVMLLINPYQKKAHEKYKDFASKYVKEIETEDGNKAIAVEIDKSQIYETLSRNSEISTLASKIIPESLFVSLISQYDAFLNRLLRHIFEIQPNILNNSERTLNFSQLVEFESIESAREYVIEKEIETVLRKNHNEHFEYFENKLKIPLRKDLPVWKDFIEITERRNLFVHCDGRVSSQYIKVCQENGCNLNGISINERLSVPVKYFSNAYNCLFEIAVKLTHTIWRKLLINDLKKADSNLNDICFDLINAGKFKLADILLDFACSQKKFFNDAHKNVFIVNKSLSQYLQGNKEKAKEIIETKDWSASSDDFKLAHLILIEDYDNCYTLMKKIGDKGEVSKEYYMSWPIFNQIRIESKFKETFKEIFNEEYNILEIPKKPLQEIFDEFVVKKNISKEGKEESGVKRTPIKSKYTRKTKAK
jgi:hypothetical protein